MTDKNLHWALSLRARILRRLSSTDAKKDSHYNLLLYHLEDAFIEFENEIPNGLTFSYENINFEEEEKDK
jgi:hypothetical protein